MTDTANRKKEAVKANNGMRSTHPTYTEYNMSSLQRQNAESRSVHNRVQPQYSARSYQRTGDPNKNIRQVTTLDKHRELERQRSRELERARAIRRREEAQRLAAETKKRAAAAAKEAARQAKRTQAKVFRDLRRLNTIKLEDRYTFPVSIVLTAVAFTVLIFAIVTTTVQISEINTENLALRRTYESLVADENKLQMELEVRDDLRTVESLAKNEYGMVKQDQVERYYLKTYNADKIELIEAEDTEETTGWLEKLTDALGSIGRRVLSFFGK